jgi:predicted nucleotidyltransferase component of viral defense system
MRIPLRSTREQVEIFHLVFLRLLSSGPDRSHFVVKGGCNLRFWHGSARCSEDIDFDVRVAAKDTLRNKVDRLLDGVALRRSLAAQRLRISHVARPKQTEVTQRWKIALVAESGAQLHTKVEFSRRGGEAESAYDPIDRDLLRRYALPSTLAQHYGATAAVVQKVAALVHRAETQARDVFDLAHLFARAGTAAIPLEDHERAIVPLAIERAMSVSYDDYSGQVLAFLEEEHRRPHASRAAWELLQNEVVARLEELAA